jgi:hypothetical protein
MPNELKEMMRAILIFSLMSAINVLGDESNLLTKQDLFIGVEIGYAKYRIPGIVVTAKRSVLAYCEARRTGTTDWDDIDILM